jgi:FixJ family two-component response regulator
LERASDPKPAILIVDDEEIIRSLLAALFERDGRFEADLAVDGVDALRAIGKKKYSLVITDLQMPNLGGLDLLRRIRETHPQIPVIVFTGYGDLQDAIEALRLGAVNFLRKPFELREILPSVVRAIEVMNRTERRNLVYDYIDSITLHLNIPPHVEETVPVIQHMIDPLVPLRIIPEAEVKNVFLAIDEVLSNAIFYGALGIDSSLRDRPDGHTQFEQTLLLRSASPEYTHRLIEVYAKYSQEEVIFRIKDPGPGFDYHNLPDPTDPENLLREHGRGLLLVRCFMDDLHFNEVGNEVTLVKKKYVLR